MANVLTGNPWTLDTVSATPFWTGLVEILYIEMIDYTVDTDTVQLKDGFGRVVWEGNGAADLEPVRSGHVGTVHGLALTASNNAATRVRVYWK